MVADKVVVAVKAAVLAVDVAAGLGAAGLGAAAWEVVPAGAVAPADVEMALVGAVAPADAEMAPADAVVAGTDKDQEALASPAWGNPVWGVARAVEADNRISNRGRHRSSTA